MVVGKYEGYSERMICGTDHLPEIGPAGLPFFGPAPPIHERKEMGTANGSNPKKIMLIFNSTC